MHLFRRDFIRFLLAGLVNTGIAYSFYLLLNLVLPYKIAYTIAYATGVFFSYWLNSRFVFKVAMNLKTLLRFPLVYVVQYLAGIIFLYIFVEKIGMSEMIAPIVVIVLTVPITFLMSRYLLKYQNVHPEAVDRISK